MYNHIIYRHTESIRKTIVTKEGRDGTMVSYKGLGNLVQLKCRNTRRYMFANLCKSL